MPASCSGAMRTTLGSKPFGVTPGKYRRFGSASCGVAPGDAGGKPPGACLQATRQKFRGHPPTGHRAWAGLQAVSRTSLSKVSMQPAPQPSRCAEPRRSPSLAPSHGRGASAFRRHQSVAPAEAGAAGGEASSPAQAAPQHPYPRDAGQRPRKPIQSCTGTTLQML